MPQQISDTRPFWAEMRKHPVTVGLMIACVTFAVAVLRIQGRGWWCPAGDLVPWSWDIWSQHNSQHLIDPYSFTHMLHGVLAFWVVSLLFKRMPFAWRLLAAVMFECSWEIAENSTYIIERYRTATISLDYFGDSIINSISDVTCCGLGAVIAYKLRFARSLALFAATETLLVFWIHDSLLINIIMLIYPIEMIKVWQLGH